MRPSPSLLQSPTARRGTWPVSAHLVPQISVAAPHDATVPIPAVDDMTATPPSQNALAQTGSITIDMDGLRCYRAIHGLPTKEDEDDPIYTKALPRFCAAMAQIDARGTLFVVGSDLSRPAHRRALEQAAAAGHEIASHSYAHDYALSRQSFASISADLWRCDDAIAELVGKRPAGFRAPGYNQSEVLFDAIEALGYAYDSSFFPTPAYFAARGTALLGYRVAQRPSHSLLGEWREFASARTPFRPDRQARFRAAQGEAQARPFWEIPISVASGARIPWLGTTLSMLPRRAGSALTHVAVRGPGPCILELHAIDFLDAQDAEDSALVRAQRDLRVPAMQKHRRLRNVFRILRDQRRLMPLEELARLAG